MSPARSLLGAPNPVPLKRLRLRLSLLPVLAPAPPAAAQEADPILRNVRFWPGDPGRPFSAR
jgi:hypothetical protein